MGMVNRTESHTKADGYFPVHNVYDPWSSLISSAPSHEPEWPFPCSMPVQSNSSSSYKF
jgi:hypothetical protein